MIFPDKLQSLRRDKGLSQEKLADLIGVSRQAVSKWESGQSYPDVDKLVALSNLFHVSLDRLVKDDKDIKSEENEDFRTSKQYFYTPRPVLRYEYKSKRRLFNLPLVHINIGSGGFYVAKGILAVGNISIGLLSIGLIAVGGLSIGVLAAGLIGLASIVLGLFAAGGAAVGVVAAGGVVVGVFAFGGLAVGMFSVGGYAVASDIAIGGYASGHIAIGNMARGVKTILFESNHFSDVKASQVRALIMQEYPHLWKPVVDFMSSLFS